VIRSGTLPSQHKLVAASITWIPQQVGLVNPVLRPGTPSQQSSVVGLYEEIPQHWFLNAVLGATLPLQHIEEERLYEAAAQQAELAPVFKTGRF